MPTERKKKCFQVEVSISHKDPSMPVRRVASTHSLDYESWPSAASIIAAVIWAKAQKDLFAESAEATVEKVIIFNLFRMPLPNGTCTSVLIKQHTSLGGPDMRVRRVGPLKSFWPQSSKLNGARQLDSL